MTSRLPTRGILAAVALFAGTLAGASTSRAFAGQPAGVRTAVHAAPLLFSDGAVPAEHAALSAGSAALATSALESRGRGMSQRHGMQRTALPQSAHATIGIAVLAVRGRSRDLAHRQQGHFRRASRDGHHTSTPPPYSQG